jgi:hypothetical protein
MGKRQEVQNDDAARVRRKAGAGRALQGGAQLQQR